MPLSTWNLEWLNHNSQRNYPLADDASGYDSTGTFQIPDDFLVQLDIPIHSAMDMDPAKFFVRQIVAASTGYSIIVSYQGADGIQDVASSHIPTVSHTTEYKTYSLGGIEPFDDTAGKVTINNLGGINKQPAGVWNFDVDGSRISVDTVRPIIRGVQSLRVSASGGGSESTRLYGDVELVAGDNIQLLPVISSGSSKIVISAIDGEGTVEPCVCEGDADDLPCIKTINGVSPTPAGEFNFIGDDCLQFTGGTNAVSVEDQCCAPCCGCTELESITKDLERFLQEKTNLQIFVQDLKSSVTEMNLTVLGARLGDKGCITCE